MSVIGGGDGRRQITGVTPDDDRILDRRIVDHSDRCYETVFDFDVNGDEIAKDDALRGDRSIDHGGFCRNFAESGSG